MILSMVLPRKDVWALLNRMLTRWSRWVLFLGERFLNIELWTRSAPTALLFDFGRELSCSSEVIGSFKASWKEGDMLRLMNASRWSFGGILDGNSLLKRSRKRSAFSFGLLYCRCT